jgi:hypothetical protein
MKINIHPNCCQLLKCEPCVEENPDFGILVCDSVSFGSYKTVYPASADDRFLQNRDTNLPHYTALHTKRQYFFYYLVSLLRLSEPIP